MQNKNLFLWALLILAVCGAVGLLLAGNISQLQQRPASVAEVKSADQVTPYGIVTLLAGEKKHFPDLALRVLTIEEDSRCPADVQCIQAGTIKVKTEVVSGLGTSTQTLALGEFVTTEAEKITFVSAVPEATAGSALEASEYTFTFEVEKMEEAELLPGESVIKVPGAGEVKVPPVSKKPEGACYVGGCSSQLCTDRPDAVSTCEYKEAYACYKTASCERQQDGQCGWTQTAELNACVTQSN